AWVYGHLQRNSGTIHAPLGRHPKDRQRFAVYPEGKGRDAVTHYRVLRRLKNMTYLELTPETGRTHQLRVHLHFLGHPLIGDPRYGSKMPAAQKLARQALHAWKLGFVHPATNEAVEFTAPVPAELAALMGPP
ncbi:MAG: RluA family pseudouridine synthase, partial [Candidatus Omnitrophica bacterium]|nr:RluA family pseudouridine synthase [Candidatus Omnitrophota bacterium]